MKKTLKHIKKITKEILLLTFGVVFVLPVLFLFMNTFKTQKEMFSSFLSFPTTFNLNNYIEAWNNMHYLRAFSNTLIVTLGSVFLITILSSMAAYKFARIKSKFGTVLLMYFVLAMMLPFQTIMIPLMQVTSALKIIGTLTGYILVATALMCPFTIYLYRGFCKQIPISMEEAARIDGAKSLQTFFIIVFPLLKPVTITAIIINVMGVWNDYILALLMLQRREKMTLQISVMQYTGRYNLEWNLTLATLAIVILPVIIMYLFMQNSIQSGLMGGSLKG